jgi:thiamine-phosphate pyrophosphorylase
LAIALKKAIASDAILLINERVDVAIAAGADGVQLGEAALPIAPVRNLIGPQALIGRSVHSVEGGEMAASEGADLLLVGTMFSTRSHPGIVPVGPSLIRAIAQKQAEAADPLPVIGIGGITADNLSEVIQAGASGVAVITSILASSDPKAEASRLKDAMLDAWRYRSPIVSTLPVV